MKNYKILILLVLLVLGIGLYTRFFQKSTTAPTVAKSDYFDLKNKQIEVQNINFGETNNLKKAVVKQLSASELALALNFSGSGDRGVNALTWQTGSKNLIVNASSSFVFSDESKSRKTPVTSEEEVRKIATDYLEATNLVGDSFSWNLVKTTFVKDEKDLSPDLSGANIIVFDFEITHDGKLVHSQIHGQNIYQVIIDKNGNVIKLSGPVPVSLAELQNVQIRSANEAIENLRDGQGRITMLSQIDPTTEGKGENLSFTKVTFTGGQISYQVEDGQLLPVFEFIGTAKNPDGKDLKVIAQLPALK